MHTQQSVVPQKAKISLQLLFNYVSKTPILLIYVHILLSSLNIAYTVPNRDNGLDDMKNAIFCKT